MDLNKNTCLAKMLNLVVNLTCNPPYMYLLGKIVQKIINSILFLYSLRRFCLCSKVIEIIIITFKVDILLSVKYALLVIYKVKTKFKVI